MTSGFSTIAGAVVVAYISLGVPASNIITSSVMSIPASIAISKIRIPETEEPVTRGYVTIDRGVNNAMTPVSYLAVFLYIKKRYIVSRYRKMHCMLSAKVQSSVLLWRDKFCK